MRRGSSALLAALRGGLHLVKPLANGRAVNVTRVYPAWGASSARFMSDAAKDDKAPELTPLVYEDSFIKETLAVSRTIALVGASTSWNRPSFFAMKYLQATFSCPAFHVPALMGALVTVQEQFTSRVIPRHSHLSK